MRENAPDARIINARKRRVNIYHFHYDEHISFNFKKKDAVDYIYFAARNAGIRLHEFVFPKESNNFSPKYAKGIDFFIDVDCENFNRNILIKIIANIKRFENNVFILTTNKSEINRSISCYSNYQFLFNHYLHLILMSSSDDNTEFIIQNKLIQQ